MELGFFGTAMGERGVETLGALSSQIPVHANVAIRPIFAAHRRSDGSIVARDALLLVPIHVLNSPSTRVRLLPGISVPTGSFGEATGFNLLSTGSVDPWVGADILAGETWLGGGGLNVRVPLYDGTDGDRQGLYIRGDVRAARRIGGGAIWLGLSPVTALDSTKGQGSFTELATTTGGVVPLGEHWALNGQLRVPIIQETSNYVMSVGLGISTVFDGHGHEDQEKETLPAE